MALKSVYGLFFETSDTGLVIFYVGCTNDIARRYGEHKRYANDTKHPEYNTYKYQLIRDLAAAGVDFTLEVLTPAVEVNDKADEYSWVLKMAEHNREHAIAFYDNLPLTNMKAGDFLEEMLRDPAVRTPAEIRTWRKAKADSIRAVRYNRNTFGVQSRNEAMRKTVADAMALDTQKLSTEQVIAQLDRDRRNRERNQQIADVWEERRRHWEATGEMWGIDYDVQEKR